MKRITLFLATIVYTLIAYAQAPATGLVAYFPMNNSMNGFGAGATTITTTSFGTITPVTSSAGFVNGAMSFANPTPGTVAHYATTAITSAINFGTSADFTISINFRITSLPAVGSGAVGFFDNNLNYNGYGIWAWRSGTSGSTTAPIQLIFSIKGNALQSNISTTTINLNTWYNVTCTRSGTTNIMYLNGVLVATNTAGTSTPTYTFNPRIGTMFANSVAPPNYNGLNGALEELRIYNRALSAVEVSALSTASLPVKLSGFSASLQNGNVQLNWQTAQEQNSKHFEIERSINGINFNTIATVAASGNSATAKNYTYNDILNSNLQREQVLYYRVKMVDLDGTTNYSKIIPVKLQLRNIHISISPNPVKNIAQVQITQLEKGVIHFSVINNSGQELMQFKKEVNQQNYVFSIDISSLQNGAYTIRATTSKEIISKLFVKSD